MNYSFSPFLLNFKKAIKVGNKEVSSKSGYLLEIEDGGKKTYGELAPLKGLHENIFLEKDKLIIEEILSGNTSKRSQLSKLGHFCLESAFSLLKVDSMELKIPVNGLILEKDNPISKAPCQKIKIKRKGQEEEIDLINFASAQCDQLRLDANRGFDSLSELEDYASLISQISKIEYWEEPLKDASQYHQCHLPIALDESLPGFYQNDTLPASVVAVIIKPSLWGFEGTLKVSQWAAQKGVYPVISSSFEGVEGMKGLALLSKMVDPDGKTAMGLDTLKFLDIKKGDQGPLIKNGFLTISL